MMPPNVTGSLHIGHALNFTLQDVLVRYRGWVATCYGTRTDHAGIATEIVVGNQIATREGKRDLGREGFVARVWKWKEESAALSFTTGGSAPRRIEPRALYDGSGMARRPAVFVQLYREELIYRDKRLVNWDP
jgi:valyl-tRNA synthetase